MEIVTGSTGVAHVTPIDDAVRNSNFGYYKDRIVFDTFRGLEAVAVTANEVRIYGGYGMNQGRLFKIDLGEYDSVTIENGTQGVKRSDLIVARYTMESQTGFEHIKLAVIKGQSGNTYTDPVYTTGNINEGDTLDDFPLYRVKVNGIVIEAVEPLFTPTPDGGRLGVLEKRLDGKMRTNLSSESEAYLDGSEHVKIGVEGILPVSHGGTGASDKDSAINNLADGAGIGTNIFSDDDVFLSKSDRWYKKTIGNLWTYFRDKMQSFLGMGNSSIVPVAHGGTGKASITEGSVLVGNGTATPSEKGIDTTPTENSDNLITSGGVAKALTASGLGDMLKSTYDPNGDGIIDVQQGGIGNRGINSTTGGVANSSALTTAGALYATVQNLQASFQNGVDTIKNAFISKGVTPSASTPSALATAVDTAYETGRSLGDSEGYTRGHAQGLEDGQHIVKLGSGTSYNVSSYKGYKNFTKDNFIVKIKNISITNQMVQSSHSSGMGMSAPGTKSNTVTPSVSYNASTGTVTISNLSGTCNNSYYPTTTITSESNVTVTASVDVYLVY